MLLKAALLGRSLSHSVSPYVHDLLFSILSPRMGGHFQDIQYDLVECEATCDVAQWLKTAPTNGYIGANVTHPYKSTAFSLTQNHSSPTLVLESGNTISIEKDGSTLWSTDGHGWLCSLKRENRNISLSEFHLVIFGAGSAARAVALSAVEKSLPRSLTVIAREEKAGAEVIRIALRMQPELEASVIQWNADFTLPAPKLVINATPVGQLHGQAETLPTVNFTSDDIASDLVYNPYETGFLRIAKASGAATLSGLGMLIEQAALAQMIWMTGTMPGRSPLEPPEFAAVYSKILPLL